MRQERLAVVDPPPAPGEKPAESAGLAFAGERVLPLWRRFWHVPVFALWVVIVGITVAHHEPWFDEAQSWLIARDADWADMLGTLARYEGTPMLWHMVLAIPAKLGLPYISLHVVSAAFACAGMWMLLTRSPLPKVLLVLLPFTFFLGYQNVVVARSYVMMPILLYLAASGYSRRFERPMFYALPLCILAHVSAHGLFIASALMAVFGMQACIRWRRDRRMLPLRLAATALLVFGLSASVAAWEIRPAADHVGGFGFQQAIWPRVEFALERWSGAFTDNDWLSSAALAISLVWFWRNGVVAAYLAATLAVLTLFVIGNCWYHHESVLFFLWLFALWISFENYRRDKNCGRDKEESSFLLRDRASEPGPLSLWERVRVRVLSFAGVRPLHDESKCAGSRAPALLHRGAVAVVAAVLALQVYWAFASIRHDLAGPYSGAKALADYLRREGLDSKRIATTDMYAVAMQPYFDRNLFVNLNHGQGPAFVHFNRDSFARFGVYRFPMPIAMPFDVLIVGVKHPPFCMLPWDDPKFELPLSPDFRCVGYFPGACYWKTGAYERDDYVCYVRKGIPASRYDAGNCGVARQELPVRNIERIPTAYAEVRVDTVPKAMAASHGTFGTLIRALDSQAARDHFQTAVQLWPEFAAGHVNLGAILEKTDPQEALRQSQIARALDPENAEACTNIGNIYARAAQFETAICYYREAIRLNPDLDEARNNLRMAMELSKKKGACPLPRLSRRPAE